MVVPFAGMCAGNALTRDIPKAEIEAALAAEEACEQAEAEEVEAVPEVEVVVPEIEVVVPEAEACAEAAVEDDGYPEGYDAETIIF